MAQRGPSHRPSLPSQMGDLKSAERPMNLRKLNQIRPDQTEAICDTGFTIYESWYAGGWWAVVCELWLQTKAVSTLSLCHRTPRRSLRGAMLSRICGGRRAATPQSVRCAEYLRTVAARQCPPPKGESDVPTLIPGNRFSNREFSFTDIHSNSLMFTDIHPFWKKICGGLCSHTHSRSNPFQTFQIDSNAFQPIPITFKKIK